MVTSRRNPAYGRDAGVVLMPNRSNIGCGEGPTGCTRASAFDGHRFAGSIHVRAILRGLRDARMTRASRLNFHRGLHFMMRPLTIAAGLLLAPLLLTAHAQQP